MWGNHTNLIRDEFPSLGAEGVQALTELLDRLLPEYDGGDLPGLQQLLEQTAEELGGLLGSRGVEAVLTRALIVARAREPALEKMLAILPEKIEVHPSSGRGRDCTARSFCRFYLTAMEVTSSLIGFDLVQPVLRRVELRRKERG